MNVSSLKKILKKVTTHRPHCISRKRQHWYLGMGSNSLAKIPENDSIFKPYSANIESAIESNWPAPESLSELSFGKNSARAQKARSIFQWMPTFPAKMFQVSKTSMQYSALYLGHRNQC